MVLFSQSKTAKNMKIKAPLSNNLYYALSLVSDLEFDELLELTMHLPTSKIVDREGWVTALAASAERRTIDPTRLN